MIIVKLLDASAFLDQILFHSLNNRLATHLIYLNEKNLQRVRNLGTRRELSIIILKLLDHH